ncbi:MAG: hypothetical protein GYA58_12990 [Anaerolineaceae bacterium]|nr:hypothetical protein [Anaerolineaceae bacterium]
MSTPPEVLPPSSDVTSDDRLWVLLCFLFTPLFPVITFFLEDKKERTFIKYHNAPTLILGIVEIIVVGILSFVPVVNCFTPLIWIINVVYAVKANKGENVNIPVITDFSKQQGWS